MVRTVFIFILSYRTVFNENYQESWGLTRGRTFVVSVIKTQMC